MNKKKYLIYPVISFMLLWIGNNAQADGFCLLHLPHSCKEVKPQYVFDHQCNQVKDGKEWRCGKNGLWLSIWTWHMGKKTGKSLQWHSNGQKQEEGFYFQDKRCGKWRCWQRDGKPTSCPSRENCQIVKDGIQCPPCPPEEKKISWRLGRVMVGGRGTGQGTQPKGRLSLSKAEVAVVIQRQGHRILRCRREYAPEVRQAILQWSIQPSGKTETIRLPVSGNPQFLFCVRREMLRWKFPAFTGASSVELTVPFGFTD